jgi:hypothetical protein
MGEHGAPICLDVSSYGSFGRHARASSPDNA